MKSREQKWNPEPLVDENRAGRGKKATREKNNREGVD